MEYTNLFTGARVIVDVPVDASAGVHDRARQTAIDILRQTNHPMYSEVGLNKLLDP